MATYDECRSEYERTMGSELGKLYHLLWNECAHLHMLWDEYAEMFGKNQEQFDIMNGVAPSFFLSVQNALWERILLFLCRFGDNKKVAHRRTLSLETLLVFGEQHAIPGLAAHVTDAKTKIKFAQDWRNRSIAHKDLEHAFERSAKPLADASRVHVKEALAAIAAVLAVVEKYFTGSDLAFEGSGHSEGPYLLSELRLIARLRSERTKRIEIGTATADDLDWKKWH